MYIACTRLQEPQIESGTNEIGSLEGCIVVPVYNPVGRALLGRIRYCKEVGRLRSIVVNSFGGKKCFDNCQGSLIALLLAL